MFFCDIFQVHSVILAIMAIMYFKNQIAMTQKLLEKPVTEKISSGLYLGTVILLSCCNGL